MAKYTCTVWTIKEYNFNIEATDNYHAKELTKNAWQELSPPSDETIAEIDVIEIIENKPTLGDYSQEPDQDLPF